MIHIPLKSKITDKIITELSNPKLILLKKLPQEVSKNINFFYKYDITNNNEYQYEYEDEQDLKPFELELKNGYEGGKPLINLNKEIDIKKGNVFITTNNVIFYNDPLNPNRFDVNGIAVINNNDVFLIEQFKRRIEVRNDDYIVEFKTSNINGIDLITLFSI